MLAVLYATYLYSSPDRRPSIFPTDVSTDYRKLKTGEDLGITEDERSSSLEELPLEKRV